MAEQKTQQLPGEPNLACKKTSWPEVVGLTARQAEEKILKDMPDAIIEVIPEGNAVTSDFVSNRVRIIVGKVVEPYPRIG